MDKITTILQIWAHDARGEVVDASEGTPSELLKYLKWRTGGAPGELWTETYELVASSVCGAARVDMKLAVLWAIPEGKRVPRICVTGVDGSLRDFKEWVTTASV